jgi:hypothetical protein
MQVARSNSDELSVQQLPDGSRVIVDPRSEKVFALNTTAGAAWDACGSPTTLAKVTAAMQRSLDARTTEELALEAILQLQEQNLVKTSLVATSGASPTTRRAVLVALGGIALPVVVSMTLSEQRAYAGAAGSIAVG